MLDYFMGSIRLFSFNFNPANCALCDGALLPISKNTALFSLLGTMYGGDGKSTFALPDMRGRVSIGVDNGAELRQGETGGAPTAMLTKAQMPVTGLKGVNAMPDIVGVNVLSLLTYGEQEAFSIMQPGLGVNYCIALQGVYPQRPY